MLTCKQSSQLISQSLDKSLTWSERLNLKFHLFICKYCARFYHQLHTVKAAVDKLRNQVEQDESITLSEEAKAKMIQKINE